MLLTVANVLTDQGLEDCRDVVTELSWKDGRITAGKVAAAVKSNLQADLSGTKGEALRTKLQDAILGHPVVRAFARPRRLSPVLISKTTDGGHYGPHVDNALMKTLEGPLRTDISFTLSLTDPETYEGGELTIHLPGIVQTVRPAAGDLVLYPSSAIHEVTPVTQGERVVCVGWIQSLIRDGAMREILFDLENLRVSLRQQLPQGSAELLTLDKSIANILRLHADP